jgi:hypothetical protein
MATTHTHAELEKVVNEALKAGDLSILQAYKDKPYNRAESMSTPEDVIKTMADWANSFSVGKQSYEELTAHFFNQHRTNQQSMMKAIVALIVNIADKPDTYFDGRNADMQHLCRYIKNCLDEKPGISSLPMI